MFVRDAGPGVHAIVHGHTNCFIVADDDGVTLVDASYPSTWRRVEAGLHAIGRTVDDVRGLVLTHGHFDHLGFASDIQRRYGIPIWAHPGDDRICAHPYRYRPGRPRALYPIAYPRAIPVLTSMVVAGALRVPGVTPDHALVDGATLPLPGRPRVISTPGHTDGSCVFWLPERGVLLSGDALVTLDPYSGRTGPRMVGRGGTHDGAGALASARALAGIDAQHLLPGHGDMWHGGVAAAVRSAAAAL